jgi:single-strand selective monofunctional uracil DNA glycosylase
MTENLITIAADLALESDNLAFGPPVAHVYNPLRYAWFPHTLYLDRYGTGTREIILLGMNPGPWGMAQTGEPFGDVEMVRNWLRIEAEVNRPEHVPPKRPIQGFRCGRREVSGQRLWGLGPGSIRRNEEFFSSFFCGQLLPLELSGGIWPQSNPGQIIHC